MAPRMLIVHCYFRPRLSSLGLVTLLTIREKGIPGLCRGLFLFYACPAIRLYKQNVCFSFVITNGALRQGPLQGGCTQEGMQRERI